MTSETVYPLSELMAIKLASLVVHVQEYTSDDGHDFDIKAAEVLANDPSVVSWLEGFDPVLLPRKRSAS